jgi:cytochrome b561
VLQIWHDTVAKSYLMCTAFLINMSQLPDYFEHKMQSNSQYYTKTAQVIHWIMAIIFITAWLIGFYSGNFLSYENDGSFKGDVITLHKNIATTIIFLVVIRIFWRYTHPVPALPNSMSPMMKTMAHLGHLVLYLLLLALPITGCLFSWSAGHPAPVLYLFNIPQLIGENPQIMSIVKPMHIYLSWFAGFVVAGHILMALKHHFIDKDNVLRSMLRQK